MSIETGWVGEYCDSKAYESTEERVGRIIYRIDIDFEAGRFDWLEISNWRLD